MSLNEIPAFIGEKMTFKTIESFKLIVCDIDGTLMEGNRLLSPEFVKTIYQLQKRGISFTFASGRLPYKIQPLVEQIRTTIPIVACNGSLVYQEEQLLFEKKFPILLLRSLIRKACHNDDTILYSFDGVEYCYQETKASAKKRRDRGIYYPLRTISHDEWSALKVIKVNILSNHTIASLHEELDKLKEQVSITYYGDTGVEIVCNDVSKLSGVHFLSSRLKIPLNQMMAFGDNENDASLLKAVGYGIAVANATKEIKKIAHYVTKYPGEKGVNECLKKFLKLGED